VSETANFVLNSVNVTIGTAPTGLLVSVDNGAAQTAPVNVSWVIGSKHVITTTSPQGSNGTRYAFTGWSDGGGISHQVTVSSATTTYTATFSASYLLTTSVTPSGSGSVTPLSGNYYPAGTVVNLKASANSGYTFQQWTGAVANSKSASTTITMSAPESVTADFTEGSTVLIGTIIGEQGAMTDRQWKIGVLNVGPGAANGAQITSLSLVQAQGPKCTPVVVTSMPLALGNLAPGGTTEGVLMIDFNGCSTNTRFAVRAPLSANNGKAAGLLIVPLQAP
jgi:Divergent InlB B-repeat domain